jgi:hypothetical protein
MIHSPCEGRDGQRPSRVKNNELLRGTIMIKMIIMRMKKHIVARLERTIK